MLNKLEALDKGASSKADAMRDRFTNKYNLNDPAVFAARNDELSTFKSTVDMRQKMHKAWLDLASTPEMQPHLKTQRRNMSENLQRYIDIAH